MHIKVGFLYVILLFFCFGEALDLTHTGYKLTIHLTTKYNKNEFN